MGPKKRVRFPPNPTGTFFQGQTAAGKVSGKVGTKPERSWFAVIAGGSLLTAGIERLKEVWLVEVHGAVMVEVFRLFSENASPRYQVENFFAAMNKTPCDISSYVGCLKKGIHILAVIFIIIPISLQ